jgi:hypothetical protein
VVSKNADRQAGRQAGSYRSREGDITNKGKGGRIIEQNTYAWGL